MKKTVGTPKTPQTQHSERTAPCRIAAEATTLLLVPLVLCAAALLQIEHAAALTLLVVLAVLVLFFGGYEKSAPPLRHIMPTVVLAALAAAGRIVFAPIPDVKPVSAICIMAGAVFGRRCGFMVGALAALCSNFFFGQGPWTPWQMYAWGMVGYMAGLLAQTKAFERMPMVLAYGFLSGLLYGFLVNAWYVVGYIQPLSWPAILAAYAAALPFDCVHGAATVAFLALLYAPWRRKLQRIKRKYALS